jgi:cell surface protein SprA
LYLVIQNPVPTVRYASWHLWCLFLVVICLTSPATAVAQTELPEIGFNLRLETEDIPLPFAEPARQGWSISTFDTTGTYGPYRGLLDPTWNFARRDEVEENIDWGFARAVRYEFGRATSFPYVMPLDEYRNLLMAEDNRRDFRETCLNSLGTERARQQGGGLNIQLPTRIRSKTFQKIFGGDRVGLSVTGDVSISGGFRREKRDQLQSNLAQNANYNFRIDQSQRFTIVGQVGDKVSVRVDQDSERLFEFQNAIKLEYTGYDDEIIQKIEAGNVNLSLSGTRLASFSTQNRGLFGLKTQLKVGPLDLTAIASMEKGEKNKFTVSSGATQTTQNINNNTPRLNTYFFVDHKYRENFRYFNINLDHGRYTITAADSLAQFELYRSVASTVGNITGTLWGWAVNDPTTVTNWDTLETSQNPQQGLFQRLEPNLDYELDRSLGYVRLASPLSTGTILACAYASPNDTVGDIIDPPEPGDSLEIHLKLLRPENPVNSDSTWDLMFRNVYYLNAANIQQDGFEIKIKYDQSGAADEEDQVVPDGSRQTYLTIFGLDRVSASGSPPPDGQIDNNPSIISWQRGEIIFPDLRPFDPQGYYVDYQLTGADLLDPDRRLPAIYDTTAYTAANFYIEVKYTNVSSVFNLGFNVLENSEEVYLNGAQLNRGTDYTIDYLSGQLTILNEAAMAPGANLEILYESGAIFQLDKKTLFGLRAEYELWQSNPKSFLGGTMLYLSEKPLDRRVRVGSEPMRNFLWDVNSRLIFKPEILTSAVDALPLVESDLESQITIEGEVAQVFPNPNSLNSPSTGDNQGVAYVDDFESIKRSTPLGIMRRTWTLASFPEEAPNVDQRHGRQSQRPLIWYNPYDQVPIQEIWPDREVNANVAQNTHILTVRFWPDTESGLNPSRSWNGIMRYLPAGYNDQSDSKYLEIWLKNENLTGGMVYIDLGQISEDVIPNSALDTEDQPLAGTSTANPRVVIGNGILDEGEDVGLDGLPGSDPADSVYINGPQNPPVPSFDDWSWTVGNRDYYMQINGTQGNANDENGRYPDTEDLDGDNFLDMTNNFFRFGFELGNAQDSLKYIAGGQTNPYGWRLYRIPLTDALQGVGAPIWTQIEYARIWFSGFSQECRVSIATMELVGNDWKEIIPTDSGGVRDYVSVAVVNTHENPGYYSPPGVFGEVDPITDVRAKEQSLSMLVHGLPPENPIWVTRTLYQNLSLIEYKKLKMFVHGGGHQMATFPDDQIEFMFKFVSGNDTTNNYYQYIETLQPGWHPDNEIIIDFNALTSLKLSRPPDTTKWGEVYNEQGDSILVVGNPSLTSIQYLSFGVRRKHREPPVVKISTEIWVDELRVADIYREPGMAGRVSMSVNFADLANVTAEITAQEAEFHNVNIRMPGTYPQDQFNQSYSGTLNLNKFFNPRWGLRVPLHLNYSRNASTPKYYAGSDILVNRDNPPDSVKTLSTERSASVDFSKTTPSANPFVRYSLDKMTANFSITRRRSSNPTTEYNTSAIQSGSFAYNLNIDQGGGLGIFSFTEGIPILNRLAESRLYYKPTRLSMNLSGNENLTQSLSRSGVYNRTYTLQITRGVGTGIRPFQSLSLDITRNHRSDLREKGVEALLEGDFGRDYNIDQTVNASYNPQIVSFLNTDASYRTSYGWNWVNNYAQSGQTVTNQNNMSAGIELKTQDILSPLVGDRGRAGGQRPSPQPRTTEPEGRAPYQPGMFPGELEKEGEIPPTMGFPEGEKEGGVLQPPPRTEPITQGEQEPPEPPPEEEQIEEEETKEGEEEGKPEGETPEKKPAPSLLDGAKFLLSKIGNIRFDYSLQNNLSHPTVSGQADWRYQLGLSRSPGVDIVPGYTATASDSRTDDYRVSSSLNFTRNIRLSFDYNYKETGNRGSTNTGSTEHTAFFTLNRTQVKASDFPMVNWSLSWSGLETTPLFKDLAQSVSLDNAFTGRKSDFWSGTEDNITRIEYSRSFNPLASITLNWRGGVNSSIRYNLNQTLTDQLVSGTGKTFSTQRSLSAQISYSRESGFRIPLPFWPFKNRRFSNRTNFSLTFNLSSNRTEGSVGEGGELQETSKQDSWSIAPRVDYTFSNSVTGGIHLETGVNKDKLQGKTSFIEFGLSVNIAIRG